METTIDTELVVGWLGGVSVVLLVAWARIETKLSQLGKSLTRLWDEFDELHPRQPNPGHRKGIRHTHEEE